MKLRGLSLRVSMIFFALMLTLHVIGFSPATHPRTISNDFAGQARKFNPDYPRIVNLWGWYDERLGLDFYAKYDLLIPGVFSPVHLDYVRSRNPHLKTLLTMPATYEDPFQTEWAEASPQDPEYRYLLRDPQGNILYESYFGHPMFNMTVITVTEIVADYAYQQFLAQKSHYDGLFFDRIHRTISWMFEEIDADDDGQADDSEQLDAAWEAGMTHFLTRLRSYLPDAIIAGNGADLYFAPWLNGTEYEDEIRSVMEGRSWVSWSALMENYQAWMATGREPRLSFIMSAPPWAMRDKYGVNPWDTMPPAMLDEAMASYQWMRFGLTSALMGDGLFGFDFGDTWHGNYNWYDEFDNAGRETGYLGRPLGAAYRVIEALTTTNQIQNGDFEADLAQWNFWVNEEGGASATLDWDTTTAASGSASAKVTVDVPTVDYYVSFQQGHLSVVTGTEYTVSFWAKASAPRSIRLEVQRNEPPWTNYGLWASVPITTTWQEHHISFKATGTDANTKLVFALGETAEDVWLDDVRLQEGSMDVFRRDFEEGMVLVNATRKLKTSDLGGTYYKINGRQAPLDKIILDDGEAGFVTAGGWITYTATYLDFGSTYHGIVGGSGEQSATWTPEIIWPGEYEVFAWNNAEATRTSEATYTVHHENGMSTVHIDQTSGGVGWVSLGRYSFSAGTDGKVVLNGASPDGLVVADAVKFESKARFNDGSEVTNVALRGLDGIILLKDKWESVYLPLVTKVYDPTAPLDQIRNGDFENDLAYWKFWVNEECGASATFDWDTTTAASGSASAKVTIDIPTVDWYVEFQQFHLSVVTDMEYTVSFWVKASVPRSIRLEVLQNEPPWTNYGLWASVPITTTWQEHHISFKATGTDADVRLVFHLGETAGDVWLDDVRLQEEKR